MEAGTLVEWLKHPATLSSAATSSPSSTPQKGAIEIEVFEDGVLDKTIVAPGEKVPVGTVLALIRATEPAASTVATTSPSDAAPTGSGAGYRAHESRRMRRAKLAADRGVDLAHVKGTGAQGAITREDIERAAARPKTSRHQPRRHRRIARDATAIAAAMARSKREIPHYYLSTTIDMSAALAWLRAENERRPVTERLLPAVLLIKAVALALREVPELNGYWIDGAFHPGAGIHVGCAISLRGGGLVAPALHDADRGGSRRR